jgi:hypothetical protein
MALLDSAARYLTAPILYIGLDGTMEGEGGTYWSVSRSAGVIDSYIYASGADSICYYKI